MGFTDDVRQGLIDRIGRGKRYPNNKRMADELGVDPSQLNRFLKKERGLNADSLGQILDKVGAKITFEDDPADASRGLLQNGKQRPRRDLTIGTAPEDYIAVPLTSPESAARPGTIPETQIKGWVLVWRHQESIRFRSNLVAVEIDTNDFSMAPTLNPGDIALIDRNDQDPTPTGKIALTNTPGPDGGSKIRRVSTKRLDGDLELVFYSDDNRRFPPTTCRLEGDFHGDISRAIGGSVVWAWNDMTHK